MTWLMSSELPELLMDQLVSFQSTVCTLFPRISRHAIIYETSSFFLHGIFGIYPPIYQHAELYPGISACWYIRNLTVKRNLTDLYRLPLYHSNCIAPDTSLTLSSFNKMWFWTFLYEKGLQRVHYFDFRILNVQNNNGTMQCNVFRITTPLLTACRYIQN